VEAAEELSNSSRPQGVTLSGSEQQILDLVSRLVDEEIRAYQLRGRVVCRGTATLAQKLRASIAQDVLNNPACSVDCIRQRIAAAIVKEGPKVKKVLAPEDDPDYGPFALLTASKRYPGRKREGKYGLSPDSRYTNPQDAYEHAAIPETRLPTFKVKTAPATVQVGGYMLNRIVPDKPNDESVDGPEQPYKPRVELDRATIESLDSSFLWDAADLGLRLIVKSDLSITHRRILETALEMAQERMSEELANQPKRKSRAKVPAFPAWTEVAARLKLHPKTVQLAIQKLRQYPASKLFALVPR
jgi:hypothetical protein